MDRLEKVIRPIVEGQLRSFANDHPEVVKAINWYSPRADKKTTFVNSVAKRIIRDLLCPMSRARLVDALRGIGSCGDVNDADVDFALRPQEDGVEFSPAPSSQLRDLSLASESPEAGVQPTGAPAS